MRELSEREIRELGEAFGVPIADDEMEYVAEQANGNLEGLDGIYDLDLDGGADYGERSWRPGTDEYNAVVTECSVPPTDGGSDLLDGATVGVKDIIAVAGVPMECGSGAMQGFVPGFDAAVIERLRAAGATITAKTNLDEFAGGGRGMSFDGQIRNPHDTDRSPGGSSGGSAVAVATGMVDVALGTDTGGSVRAPADHCGIVGLKATYGLVPIHGVVENTYTLDHVGPMTRTVGDAARVLEAIAGKDERDPASMAAAGRDGYRVGGYVDAASDPPDVGDLAFAVVEEGIGEGVAEQPVDDDVAGRTEAAADAIEDAGASVERVSIESYEYATPIKDALSYVELAEHWRSGAAAVRRGGVIDEGYQRAYDSRIGAAGGEVNPYYRARLVAGAHLAENHGGRHYTRAQAARELMRAEFEEALDGVDALVVPTKPDIAPRIEGIEEPGWTYARNTKPANVTGWPAITVPNGTVDGVPVSIQLMGRPFREADLIGAAAAVEPLLPERPRP